MEALDIIVLGKKLEHYGPTPDYKNRLDKAVEVYRANNFRALYPRIIITGGIVGNKGISEARAGFEYLRSMYFSHFPSLESAITLEEQARGTLGNATFTKVILLEHGVREPIVVTSDYHMKRAEFTFNYVYDSGITPVFVESSSGLDGDELRRVQAEEEESLRRTKEFFRKYGIKSGNHGKILETLKRLDKYYIPKGKSYE